ncbi:hypothetical protein SAMN05444487_10183 [Marininema mesophilum]|uniref:Uncharacterized protein n=2 Tax=Marininema mesophilum TaxID=1048340 RepID=A0A1H2Q324_9BACL|nr:hypothetical protein SAMN05444487_10183 [Marininema mesophilum]
MRNLVTIFLVAFIGLAGSTWGTTNAAVAAPDDVPPGDFYPTIKINDTFNEGTQGWTGEFADLPHTVENPALYQVKFDHEFLPLEIDSSQKGLSLTGMNRSDDLFMFVKKQIKVKPNTRYQVDFNFDIATNAVSGMMGVGGSPGESVYVKAGASSNEPKPIIDGDYYRLNLDKGNQTVDGINAIKLGNLAKIQDKKPTYQVKNFNNQGKPFYAESDFKGNLWLFVGTDSGFEGLTKIYFPRIEATLTEQPNIEPPPNY